jgi:hypothetical protein
MHGVALEARARLTGTRVGTALVCAFTLTIALLGFQAVPVVAAPAGPLEWSTLSVGDIVAQGVKVQQEGVTACEFPRIEVVTPAAEGVSRGLDLRRDGECRLVVYAKFEDGVRPAGTNGAAAAATIKTFVNDVWMYGIPGPWEKLTEVKGKLKFSYTGSSATLLSGTN